ncbi:MAG: NAD(P)/FAD-dependent oxidoreductase [Deltaproteobacteria bacterium]|nr:NAD(P)/FAD-dependent oxidoreductase [Deltaproteobacteria bacterium]MBW2397003.1 NAD(P)/FAD-dependent oxidoreductase [Deltaproteobacteria bacterium]
MPATSSPKEPRDLRFLILGAGMSGILSAIKLQEAGLNDFAIYEKAKRLGGTWRENRYPGVACDVPSHLYSYSFAPNPDWSHRFAPGSEIQAYFEEVARKYGVDQQIQYGKEVTRCVFENGRWQIEFSDGTQDEGDILLAATGVLHHPAYPEIKGLESFEGKTFHSARWDESASMAGKRVGVIGTGSTAIQIVSALAPEVAKLTLFQRTAQWVMPQQNPTYTAEEKNEFRVHPEILEGLRSDISRLFADGFSNAVVDANSPQLAAIEAVCLQNLEENIKDPTLREKLRPDYRAACKRLIMSEDFYDAIQRPNAELVTEGIDRIEKSGIRTVDGKLHELDVLVLATGFRVDRFMRPMEVIGRNGVSLEDAWAKRPSAYMAISIPDFPNLFMLNGPNGPVGNFSLIEVAELQFAYIMQLVELIRTRRCSEVSASQEATDRFDANRVEAAKKTVWQTGCRSWYLDDRGVPAAWPWTFDRFREEMATPHFSEYELC